MTITEKIFEALQETVKTGSPVKVNLREASTITGSGYGIGGRTFYDDAFASLRYANPFRKYARQISTPNSSAVQFVAKVGNTANSTNPWLYAATPNSGSPDVETNTWQLPTRVLSAQLPVRTAAMSDINYIQETLIRDMILEFSQLEAQSMVSNDDQSGSSTTSTGAVNGLRGLNYYDSGSSAAFGTSGNAITDGIHTITTVTGASTLTYNNITALASALPAQYWNYDSTCWMMHPSTIQQLRELTGENGMPVFLEVGNSEGSAVGNIFGHEVIPNPYIDEEGSGAFPVYLADWNRFTTMADVEEMTIQAFEQTAPGFITLYAEKRVVSTVLDPFAGVRLTQT